MFTGIVEETGSLHSIKKAANSAVLTIHGKKVLDDLKIGDSVAVNGVCLTVTELSETKFSADVMHETIARSSLRQLHAGTKINLERAMLANGRFGGHIVSGHIDGTGVIRSITRDDNAIWYRVRAESKLLRYIIEKGSVALDGISLTVAEVTDNDFSVSVIPHTVRETNLSEKKIGDILNIENDCIGKYVEKLLQTKEDSQNIFNQFKGI